VEKLNLTLINYGVAMGGGQFFFGATYDNGDYRDFWCDNFKPIPSNIITNLSIAYGLCSSAPLQLLVKYSGFLIKPVNLTIINFGCK